MSLCQIRGYTIYCGWELKWILQISPTKNHISAEYRYIDYTRLAPTCGYHIFLMISQHFLCFKCLRYVGDNWIRIDTHDQWSVVYCLSSLMLYYNHTPNFWHKASKSFASTSKLVELGCSKPSETLSSSGTFT